MNLTPGDVVVQKFAPPKKLEVVVGETVLHKKKKKELPPCDLAPAGLLN